MSTILNCGIWDIENLFDSNNNVEVGKIVKDYTKTFGMLPNYNEVYT